MIRMWKAMLCSFLFIPPCPAAGPAHYPPGRMSVTVSLPELLSTLIKCPDCACDAAQ